MSFFGKPVGGPDAVGGLFPRFEKYRFNNGGTNDALLAGEPVVFDLVGTAAAITATDSNAFLPGYNEDTVWDTVRASSGQSAAALGDGCIAGVALEAIATNADGDVCVYGICDALCNGTNAVSPGDNLYLQASTNALIHSATTATLTNLRAVAFYIDPRTNTSRASRKVFFHNGLFGGLNPAT